MRVPLTIPIAASALLLSLAGCGGTGTDTSTVRSAPASSQPTQATTGSKRTSPTSQSQGQSSPAPRSPAPSRGASSHNDSDAGVVAFKTKGGDNTIQESGSEGSAAELNQAAVALHGYLDSRAAGEWGRACAFVSSALVGTMGQLATGGGGGNLSCPKLVALLSAGIPPTAMREGTVADVGALRVKGKSAFLLFHGAHGADYFIPMAREGDRWKVAAVAPSALQ